MSKSIEILMASHKIANQRRNQGLKIWKTTISLKSVIDEPWDQSIEQLADKAKRIGQMFKVAVKKVSPKSLDIGSDDYDYGLADLLELMCGCDTEDLVCDGIKPVEIFDSWLNELYDFADIERIWTGD